MSKPGCHIAVLGLDGIGKGLVTDRLEALLKSQGHVVQRVSWERCVLARERRDQGEYPFEDLARLWVHAYAAYFAGATLDGAEIPTPADAGEVLRTTALAYPHRIEGMRGTGPFTTAWVETAAFLLIHHDVIQPLKSAGVTVIQESPPYKSLVKSLLTAEYLDPGLTELVGVALDFAAELSGHDLKPDLGIYVIGDFEQALTAKEHRGETPHPFESFSAAGGDPRGSFLEMQSGCARHFDQFADAFGWARFDLRDVDDGALAACVAELAADQGRGSS